MPHLGGNEHRYVTACLEENFVSSVGPFVDRFESEFAAAVGAPHAVACASGTAALHVGLRLCGARPGTTVAVSDFTFIASANAIAYTGARPLLVDSEAESWNLDGELLHAEVERRASRGEELPAAIEAVHVLGHPARLEPLLDLRERYGIPLVEDAAEALGATYADGRSAGTVGDIGCFSFNGNKVITTGGGGMLVTADAHLAARAKHLTTQAKIPGRGYLHDEVAYNYRLTNVAAALGVAQLEQLPAFVRVKRSIAERYDAALTDLPVARPPRASWARPSLWLYSVLLEAGGPDREAVLDALQAGGIQARPLWPPLHRQAPYTRAERLGGGVADDLYTRGISLPSSVGLTAEDQERVIQALRDALL
ncbi:MAG: DegT/DnrJ/EryC1/StrS family aminotransferase [Actinomycetota bacterium]|nr:DegT/DnrJ/EryC1/StrS family aminotransferase [Actinomycetota bacterium]